MKVLRRLDHAAIWGAVAGTWTPIALAVLPGRAGTVLAGSMWGAAVTAAVAKTAAFERVDPKVNVLYVLMGWAGVAILPRTVRQLGPTATTFLVAGGTAYTIGASATPPSGPTRCPASTATTRSGTRRPSPAPGSTRWRSRPPSTSSATRLADPPRWLTS